MELSFQFTVTGPVAVDAAIVTPEGAVGMVGGATGQTRAADTAFALCPPELKASTEYLCPFCAGQLRLSVNVVTFPDTDPVNVVPS